MLFRSARIQPEGFTGSGTVRIGILTFSVTAKVGILVSDERPYAKIKEVTVGKISVPKALLEMLETRVNATTSQAKYPLKVKRFELREGSALIAVELSE